MILSLLAALVLLGVLVTVHEFGHYFVGRRLGFTILEFAVGMGPVLRAAHRRHVPLLRRG